MSSLRSNIGIMTLFYRLGPERSKRRECTFASLVVLLVPLLWKERFLQRTPSPPVRMAFPISSLVPQRDCIRAEIADKGSLTLSAKRPSALCGRDEMNVWDHRTVGQFSLFQRFTGQFSPWQFGSISFVFVFEPNPGVESTPNLNWEGWVETKLLNPAPCTANCSILFYVLTNLLSITNNYCFQRNQLWADFKNFVLNNYQILSCLEPAL